MDAINRLAAALAEKLRDRPLLAAAAGAVVAGTATYVVITRPWERGTGQDGAPQPGAPVTRTPTPAGGADMKSLLPGASLNSDPVPPAQEQRSVHPVAGSPLRTVSPRAVAPSRVGASHVIEAGEGPEDPLEAAGGSSGGGSGVDEAGAEDDDDYDVEEAITDEPSNGLDEEGALVLFDPSTIDNPLLARLGALVAPIWNATVRFSYDLTPRQIALLVLLCIITMSLYLFTVLVRMSGGSSGGGATPLAWTTLGFLGATAITELSGRGGRNNTSDIMSPLKSRGGDSSGFTPRKPFPPSNTGGGGGGGGRGWGGDGGAGGSGRPTPRRPPPSASGGGRGAFASPSPLLPSTPARSGRPTRPIGGYPPATPLSPAPSVASSRLVTSVPPTPTPLPAPLAPLESTSTSTSTNPTPSTTSTTTITAPPPPPHLIPSALQGYGETREQETSETRSGSGPSPQVEGSEGDPTPTSAAGSPTPISTGDEEGPLSPPATPVPEAPSPSTLLSQWFSCIDGGHYSKRYQECVNLVKGALRALEASPSDPQAAVQAFPKPPQDMPTHPPFAVPAAAERYASDYPPIPVEPSSTPRIRAALLWRLGRGLFRVGQGLGTGGAATYKEGLDAVNASLALVPSDADALRYAGILLFKTANGNKELVGAGYKVREYTSKAVALRPRDPVLHHILGRWCYEVTSMSWVLRQVATALFGSPPSSTYEEALASLLKCEEVSLTGDFMLANRLCLALTYVAMGKKDEAKTWVKRAWEVADKGSDEEADLAALTKLGKSLGVPPPSA